ncbi:hypothetical protein D9611_004456 [Ephemerocybe angulata]|uniref:Chromatin modification-related protein n=1 Tax=Ephemerocybe angulata TaxID=980116 RepID=A0A8H5BKL3_9AGAR|nr:hypothetical protein D9611_004456 [Tulosesus angulatus]
MSSRKRRRSQAFKQQDIPVEVEEEPETTNEQQSAEPEEEDVNKDQADKEREVWDSVREERFEIVEQLPLTLHRQLSLMRQLDEQSQSYVGSLLPMLREYISLRQSIASPPEVSKLETEGQVDGGPSDAAATQGPKANPLPNILLQPPNALAPMPVPIERTRQPRTSREYLSHIAWLSEEVLRASQEKVNLAQATYDSAERHIRLLDLAIREQEVALTSTEGSIQLPDLTIPKARSTNSSSANNIDSYNAIAVQANDALNDRLEDDEHPDDSSPLERHLMKTVAEHLTINPKKTTEGGEELYCYCNRVSFGEMIACDNPRCTLEWFHLGCVGLTEPPEGEWYCENCVKFDA